MKSKKQYKWIYRQNRKRLTEIEKKCVVNKEERDKAADAQAGLTDTNYYT